VAVGILVEGINEVIATTRQNAAPMGVIQRDRWSMVLFKGSRTAMNVERDGWLVANIANDPVLYVESAFADLPTERFVAVKIGGFAMERLDAAEAYVAFAATVERATDDRILVALEALAEEVLRPNVRPVNRGFNAVIEATVHATRYIRTHDPQLKALIDHHATLIQRCGGPREWEALGMLLGFMGEPAT
jgi:hypothetical protein